MLKDREDVSQEKRRWSFVAEQWRFSSSNSIEAQWPKILLPSSFSDSTEARFVLLVSSMPRDADDRSGYYQVGPMNEYLWLRYRQVTPPAPYPRIYSSSEFTNSHLQ